MPVALGTVAETGQRQGRSAPFWPRGQSVCPLPAPPPCAAKAQSQHLLIDAPETGPLSTVGKGEGITGTKQQEAKTRNNLRGESVTSGTPDSLWTKKALTLHSEAISHFVPHVAKT